MLCSLALFSLLEWWPGGGLRAAGNRYCGGSGEGIYFLLPLY